MLSNLKTSRDYYKTAHAQSNFKYYAKIIDLEGLD